MSKSLALYAFEILTARLGSSTPRTLAEFESDTRSKTGDYPKQAPLFVTWNKNGDLRGCIGTFLDMHIEQGVSQYALISAFEDTRFSPIKSSELSQLSVSITLLDEFVEINDPQDWQIGLHGLKVLFSSNGRRYLGTFLPLVAEEQEWTKIETLWNLLRKAGFSGVSAAKTLDFYVSSIAAGSMKVVRYKGLKCGATYLEYIGAIQKSE